MQGINPLVNGGEHAGALFGVPRGCPLEEFLQAQTDGGYAKEMSDDYKRQQADLVAQTITKMDIVITTALIPGRPAPVLVTEDHIKSMKPGAVVVDLAAEAGGNCPLTKVGKVVRKHGVTIIGHGNWPSRVPETTSQLYARNLLNFLTPLWDPEAKALTLNRGDEFIQISGLVRQADISPDNRIASTRVADAKIIYKGKGEIANASRQGWLQRFFSAISPF